MLRFERLKVIHTKLNFEIYCRKISFVCIANNGSAVHKLCSSPQITYPSFPSVFLFHNSLQCSHLKWILVLLKNSLSRTVISIFFASSNDVYQRKLKLVFGRFTYGLPVLVWNIILCFRKQILQHFPPSLDKIKVAMGEQVCIKILVV